ncbi:MAG: zf-HC2 domain-containing protein [Aldersonia sp.]|nr:zf-HC2 domain-containing protein [Aldersonia sp.]
MTESTSRICAEVQRYLPGYVDGSLPRWRRRLIALHLRRCDDCAVELERQQTVAAGLGQLGDAAAAVSDVPPPGLLESLLEQAERPGVRGRAAVPARGAVSGARPGLSVALLVAGAAAGTAAGYAGWRGARAVRSRVGRGRR